MVAMAAMVTVAMAMDQAIHPAMDMVMDVATDINLLKPVRDMAIHMLRLPTKNKMMMKTTATVAMLISMTKLRNL
jgi:hypothetical protein